MAKTSFERIDQLIRREVVPATGCTEPACITLAAAYSASILPSKTQSITLYLSSNILKNAMGVGIPGTGMTGIPIAIALGIVLKAPERQLELLDKFSKNELLEATKIVDAGLIKIKLKSGDDIEKLYVESICQDIEGNQAISIIRGMHTNLTHLSLNGEILRTTPIGVDKNSSTEEENMPQCGEMIVTSSLQEEDIQLNFNLVYDYALTAPLEQLDFIYEAALQNKRVGTYALSHKHGHNLGQLIKSESGEKLFGSNPLTTMIAYTSAACDARMDGASMTVMSNSGSGNQGISATLPVLTFAETQGVSKEITTRALMMSNLMVVYVKQMLGRLSCLCGMVISGIGAAAAIVYILGGTREQSAFAIQNMVGNVAGMICDGAKSSCSLKASTGVSSALISALLAMNSESVTSLEGIVAADVDDSLSNLATLGRDAMLQADQQILQMMTNKSK